MIYFSDWDNLVSDTYGKTYSFQQQDGCKSRGMVDITIPSKEAEELDNCMSKSIDELLSEGDRGIKFSVWLESDPKAPIEDIKEEWEIDMFWEREFYPCVEIVANDLHKKGLIKAGDYKIEIDW